VQDGDGRREVPSGEELLVAPGLRLSFGDVAGTVRG
jgi:hypothetical protein